MKKSKGTYIFLLILGILIALSGILVQLFIDNGKYLGFCMGLGSAFIAIGITNLVLSIMQKPESYKRQQINENDERNIKIREKATYTTFFITMFGLTAMQLIFLLLDYTIPSIIAIVMLFIHICSFLFFIFRYDKKI